MTGPVQNAVLCCPFVAVAKAITGPLSSGRQPLRLFRKFHKCGATPALAVRAPGVLDSL